MAHLVGEVFQRQSQIPENFPSLYRILDAAVDRIAYIDIFKLVHFQVDWLNKLPRSGASFKVKIGSPSGVKIERGC